MTSEPGTPTLSFGWSRDYLEAYTSALMAQLGVSEAVTCSNGDDRQPKELWSATNVGLVRLSVVGEWDGIEATVTPWREVTGIEVRALATEIEPDPAATLTLARPPLELKVLRRSTHQAGAKGQQWRFVRAVLAHVGAIAP